MRTKVCSSKFSYRLEKKISLPYNRFIMEEKITGNLVFDINTGTFWITDKDIPKEQIQFNDSFEVKVGNEWVKTGIEISSDDSGDLVFKLKNTDYSGILDGLEVRK